MFRTFLMIKCSLLSTIYYLLFIIYSHDGTETYLIIQLNNREDNRENKNYNHFSSDIVNSQGMNCKSQGLIQVLRLVKCPQSYIYTLFYHIISN